MINVALTTLNSKYVHASLAPWCLLAGIKEYSKTEVNVKVLEGTINENIEQVFKRFMEFKPNLVCISTYIWNVTKVYELAKLIKQFDSNILICLGGPEVSYNQFEVLNNHPEIDFVSSGEGELPIALLCDELNNNKNFDNVYGLSYRLNNEIIVKEPYVSNMEPPSPYTKEFYDNLNGRICYLETSRGCPYSCAFCLSGRCGTVRFFDIEKAKKNMLELACSGSKTIKLVDRTFNAHRNRAKELFSFIIDNYGTNIPEGTCFHFEIAGDILDDETVCILQSAPCGCIQLEIGMQSFNEKTLAYINRKTNTAKLKENIQKLLLNNNMHIHIDLIAGLPYEDINSLKESFNIGYHLKSHMLQLGFLKLLHGADMREDTIKYPLNFNELPPYEVIDTPWLTKDELIDIHALEDVLDRMNNSGRFIRTLDYLIEVTKSNPFDLLMGFGKYARSKGTFNISLDDYTALIFNYFKTLDNVDEAMLRDVLVLDRISVINTGKIPSCLKIHDDNLKKIREYLHNLKPELKGIKRGIEILYSANKIVYVDYTKPSPITNQYQLNYLNLNDVLHEIANNNEKS